jgi:hypothetical protein
MVGTDEHHYTHSGAGQKLRVFLISNVMFEQVTGSA